MAQYLDVRVTLDGVKSPVWRQFMVRGDASFADLHDAIQVACGWEDYHLFVFRDADGTPIAGSPDDFGMGVATLDAAQVDAGAFLRTRGEVAYEYDFGDGWEHTVEVRALVESDEVFDRRLVGGERAFPPEDCGGVPGYEDILRVVSGGAALYLDTETVEEIYGDFDPEAFDLEAVRARFDR